MSDLKARISLTAQELFLSEGVEGVTMRRIAEGVGVSATAIYRHFRDKEEILEEIIDAGLASLSSYLRPALEAKDPFQRLKGLIDAYLRFGLEQPRYFDLAFLVPGRVMHLPEELEHHSRATFKLAVQQVALCMEAGIFRKEDPIETTVYLWSTAHGLVMLQRMNRLGDDKEKFSRLYKTTIERAIRGLCEKA
jgi:AcrR family transcriptional regulator